MDIYDSEDTVNLIHPKPIRWSLMTRFIRSISNMVRCLRAPISKSTPGYIVYDDYLVQTDYDNLSSFTDLPEMPNKLNLTCNSVYRGEKIYKNIRPQTNQVTTTSIY